LKVVGDKKFSMTFIFTTIAKFSSNDRKIFKLRNSEDLLVHWALSEFNRITSHSRRTRL